jgi:hypothetical protein
MSEAAEAGFGRVETWVGDREAFDPDWDLPAAELYDDYREWCRARRAAAVPYRQFQAELRAVRPWSWRAE